MKISIITATYNSSKTVEATVLSVINQSYSDIEYIIIDGNSNDSTLDILSKYKSKIAKIVSEPDAGIYDAINKGLRIATGDFAFVLGSDDVLKDRLVIDKIVSKIKSPNDIYYGDIYRLHRLDYYCGRFNSFKLAVKNLPHQALFYPKCVYKKKLYNLEYRLFADWAYNLELWKVHKFHYISVTVTAYNDEGSSNTQQDDSFFRNYKDLVVSNIGIIQYWYADIYHYIRNLIKKDKIRTR